MAPVCQSRRVTPMLMDDVLTNPMPSATPTETVSVLSDPANEPGAEVERSPLTATL